MAGSLSFSFGGVAIASFIATALLPFASRAEQASPGRLKIEIPFNSLSFDVAPLWVAFDQGLFQRYGIDASSGGVMQSPALVASLLSGERPVAVSGPDAVVSADLNGADIVMIAAGPRADFGVFAKAGIRQVADLKGKVIGITQFGTTHDFITRYVLRQAGLKPESDATIVPLGQANLLPALIEGRVAGAVMQASAIFEAKRAAGLTELAQGSDYGLFIYAGSLMAKKSWVTANPQAALDIVRGYVAGVAAVHTNKIATIDALRHYSGATDADLLAEDYEAIGKVLPKLPLPDPQKLRANLDESRLAAAKGADPATFVDPSFVAELQRDGFIDKLYAGQESQ